MILQLLQRAGEQVGQWVYLIAGFFASAVLDGRGPVIIGGGLHPPQRRVRQTGADDNEDRDSGAPELTTELTVIGFAVAFVALGVLGLLTMGS